MNNPIKIMDEIERTAEVINARLYNTYRWKTLRAAIEALKNREKNITMIAKRWESKLEKAEKELTQAQARIARLEECIRDLTYENYITRRRYNAFPQNVDVTDMVSVLNESPAQSAAALKAEALREAADAYETQTGDLKWAPVSFLKLRADRIEREAEGGE